MTTQQRRRTPAGTINAELEARAQALAGWPAPPMTLRPSEWPFWLAIMAARLPQSWHQVDLLHAATLARCWADIESNRRRLHREGDMVRGEARLNPRHALIETLHRRAVLLTRVLQLHGVATFGKKHDTRGEKLEAGRAAHAVRQTGESAASADKPAGGFDPVTLLARPKGRLQ